MRFKIVARQRRTVEEIWTVEANNAEEARELHYNGCSSFLEEQTIDVPEEWVEDIINLDDPDGTFQVDEGL